MLEVVFVICVQINIRFRNFCLLCALYSIHIEIYGIFASYFVCGILRGENRLGVFENRVLRKTFGSTRDGVTGNWRREYDDDLLDFLLVIEYLYVHQIK
jgi:hypothetical protein